LRLRFNPIQDIAIQAFGERILLDTVQAFDHRGYQPPLPVEDGEDEVVDETPPRLQQEADRMARARELVDGIRDQALAVGWTITTLYFGDGYDRHPVGAQYGLVCYVGNQDQIGEVTRASIELIGPPPLEIRTRFYNPDVDQPWIRRRR
jgi:hypothetical protein